MSETTEEDDCVLQADEKATKATTLRIPMTWVKASPLQLWTGPGGYSRLRLPDFKTIGI